MHIRDWSSEVCSSDLGRIRRQNLMFGWNNVLGMAVIPLVVVLVVYQVLAKDAPNAPAAKPLIAYLSPLKSADAWWFMLFYGVTRSEEHTSELQSLMRISYAVFCLKKKKTTHRIQLRTYTSQGIKNEM